MEGGDGARRGRTTAAPGRALAVLHGQHEEIRDLAAQVRGPGRLPAASQAATTARAAEERRTAGMPATEYEQ